MISIKLAEQNTFTLDYLKEVSSFYVNQTKIKMWSNKASKKEDKIQTRIKIKANEVIPHLTEMQTDVLLKIVHLMSEFKYETVTEKINDLDTVSREVLFTVMDEV